MRVLLTQCFQFRAHDRLPYRNDGRGGNTFYGVGSHFLMSDLQNRWFSLAFEAATIDQVEDSVLEQTQLRFEADRGDVNAEQSELDWDGDYRARCLDSRYSGYRWKQHVKLSVERPTLITIYVDLKFSDQTDVVTAEGCGHLLADMHTGAPPKYHNRVMWHLKRWLGETS